jgi:hypothetical protein
MKKTSLAIVVFSLVMVLTSFTSPEVVTDSNNNVKIGIDGGSTGRGRKVDVYNAGTKSVKKNLSSSIEIGSIDGGSTGRGRKVD